MKYYTDQILSLFMYLRCIIMTITRDFASHFSLLRDAHRISTATLAAIVGLKGNGNFTLLEKGNSYVSKDVEKEFEYVNQALASILFDPSRVDILDEKVIPSKLHIQPIYQVYDFQDGDNLRNIWYNRSINL